MTEEIVIESKSFCVAVITCPHCGEIAARMNIDRVDSLGSVPGTLEMPNGGYKK